MLFYIFIRRYHIALCAFYDIRAVAFCRFCFAHVVFWLMRNIVRELLEVIQWFGRPLNTVYSIFSSLKNSEAQDSVCTPLRVGFRVFFSRRKDQMCFKCANFKMI